MSDPQPGWDSVLPDAYRLVHGDRGDAYGPPWEDYQRVVSTFNALTGHTLSREDGILFMVCMKLGRIAHGIQHDVPLEKLRDSPVDGAGYLDCLWGSITNP